MKTYHYLISGRVQGVAFRHYMVREAEKLGISGTLKNLASGNVEVFAQEDDADMAQFEAFLHRGPRLARVDEQMEYQGFDIGWQRASNSVIRDSEEKEYFKYFLKLLHRITNYDSRLFR